MTVRRRFFPSRPVQQLPGQSVELALQLRPAASSSVAAPSATDPGTVGARCTGWLVPRLCGAPASALAVSTLPDGRIEIHGDSYYADVDETNYGSLLGSVWSGTPPTLDVLGRARPIPGDDFACVELDIETTSNLPFPGRHFMALVPGGTWSVEWEIPSEDPLESTSGHRVTVVGGTLFVVAQDTDGSVNAVDVLTAKAFAGAGVQVAELVFRAWRFGE